MKTKFLSVAAAMTFAAGAASAGSIQRDGDRSPILFEDGKRYFEFSVTNVSPNVSGTGTAAVNPALAGLQSGDIATTYQTYHFGYKQEVNEKLTFAIVANNPVGADISYPIAIYPFAGSTATIESLAVTGYLKYQFTDRFSAYGGLRIQSLKGAVNLRSGPAAYALTVNNDYRVGYVLGAAYEIPDIAMRLALTYESKIEHEFSDNTGAAFDVEIPQAVTLHARTGIAPGTLVFGSVRWQEWSEFQVSPPDFLANPLNPAGLPIAFGNGDYWTYELGLGRQFSENWSGAMTVGYEPSNNKPVGNLEGRDGFTSFGLAVKYSTESYDVTLGAKYFDLGSATTTTIGSSFAGNDALAVGMKVGMRF